MALSNITLLPKLLLTALLCTAMTTVSATSVYFYNDSFSSPRAHYWSESPAGAIANVSWPGSSMTSLGNNFYEYDFGVTFDDTDIIFNDNGSSQTANLELVMPNNCYFQGQWVTEEECGFGAPDSTPVTVYWKTSVGSPKVHFWGEYPANTVPASTWPGSSMTNAGNGYYKYEFNVNFDSSGVIFSNNGASQSANLVMLKNLSCYDNGTWKSADDCGFITNVDPVADAGSADLVIDEGTTVNFNGFNSTDSDGTVDSYTWSSNAWTGDLLTATSSHTFNTPGVYTVTLAIIDNDGATDSDSFTVTVVSTNVAPTAYAGSGDITIDAGTQVNFDGTNSTDSDGSIMSYRWTSDAWTGIKSGGMSSHVFNNAGVFTVTLEAEDNDGATDTASFVVTVESVNVPPVADAGGAAITINVGDTLNFDGSGSTDSDGTIAAYSWTSGAWIGSKSGVTTTYTFNLPGSFDVTLEVTDNDGSTNDDIMMVTVEDAAPVTVYFYNTGYTNPYIHHWSALPAGTIADSVFPGVAMTNDGGGYFTFEFPAALTSTNLMFSDNGVSQTGNLAMTPANNCYKNGTWMTTTACGVDTSGDPQTSSGDTNMSSTLARTAFVHLFEWKWTDVATECEDFLGPKGFSAVQVSPPSEHINTSEWWARYQPVSYQIESRGGTRAEFADMVQRCAAVGVDIYVDAVINHMAFGSGTGVAGSSFNGPSSYPIYSGQDFHTQCDIADSDYGNNASNVRNCTLVGLPDLAQETTYVRDTIAAYLNDLISMGVKGFRFDASKHMWPADISAILGRLNNNPYIFHEVIDLGGGAISSNEYTNLGDVTEFRYSADIGNVFKNGALSSLSNFGEAWGYIGSGSAIVFTDNHDNQRGHGAGGENVLTYNDNSTYDLANVFMLAWPYGYPKVMSSYTMNDTEHGGPGFDVHNPDGTNACFGSWQCEHRWRGIANAVAFRNHTSGDWTVNNWWTNGNRQIGFGRGDLGYVLINAEGGNLSGTYQTSLPGGVYCNTFVSDFTEVTGDCVGESITVYNDGTFNANVAAYSAVMIHVGAKTGVPTANGHANVGDTVGEIETDSDPTTSTTIYLADTNFSDPTAHYFDQVPANQIVNSTWPGTEMTLVDNGVYKLTIDGDYTSLGLVFSNLGVNKTSDLVFNGTDNCYMGGTWYLEATCTNIINAEMGEVTLYFKNSSYANPYLHYFATVPAGVLPASIWPGVKMQNIGNDFFSITLDAALASSGIVFNDNGADKTIDLTYNGTDNCYADGTWMPVANCDLDGPDNNGNNGSMGMTKIWVNSTYNTPYLHFFDQIPVSSISNSTWPGVLMNDEGNNIYSYLISADFTSLGVVFNDNGGAQTADLTYDGSNPCFSNGSWHPASVCQDLSTATNNDSNNNGGPSTDSDSNASSNIPRTAFVHLFEWNWTDIANECEVFLGPKGFSAVQVSPPNEHIVTQQWWARYQPVSYQLESRGGTRGEFVDMVNRCKAVGVDIYVDAIINHMAGGGGTGWAGSPFQSWQSYPDYSSQDFNSQCSIQSSDYGDNAAAVRDCSLSGLADLKLSSEYVRNTIANYLNDLIDIGVAGFRLDAAKHMWPGDLAAIIGKLNGNPYIFSEVIDLGGQSSVSSTEYLHLSDITEFKYSAEIGRVFKTGDLAWLSNFGEAWGFLGSSEAVVFTDNHDNQRGHGAGGDVLTHNDAPSYDLANVFMLAYPYGYPKVMSSYAMTDTEHGGPGYDVHNSNGTDNCFADWKCEHRWQGIANAVAFRNHTADNWYVSDWWSNGADQIAFGRGHLGYVAINAQSGDLTRTFETQLSGGQYCNTFESEFNEVTGACNGETITVNSDGTFNATVQSYTAIMLHVGAKTGVPTVDGHATGSDTTGNTDPENDDPSTDGVVVNGTSTFVFYDNSHGFGSPNMHLWNAAPANVANTTWPGYQFQDAGDGWLYIDLGDVINTANIKFNNNGASETGTVAFDASLPCYQNHTWVSLDACNAAIAELQPPSANAGYDQTIGAGGTAMLNGYRSTTTNGNIVSYVWSSTEFADLTGEQVISPAFAVQGTYTVTLTVTDDAGYSDTDTLMITVGAPRALNAREVIDPALTFPVSGEVGGGDYAAQEAFPNLSNTFGALTYITNDGLTNRLFVVEKVGRIKVFDNDPNVTTDQVSTFLDITDRVDNYHERGLLGLAFDPDYVNNGYFYVMYSSLDISPGFAFGDTVIERYSVDPSDPNTALAGTGFRLIGEPQQGGDHKGGMLKFGPNGNLFASFGDGQWSCGHSAAQVAICVTWDDPSILGNNHGQDITDLKGSMIRIKPDDTATNGYTIPTDNPHYGNTNGFREEIYANGLRNPWRFDVDLLTGDIYVGDVGHETTDNTYEEVNKVVLGGNYGWPVCEGTQNRGAAGSDTQQDADCAVDFDAPHASYQHFGSAASIIGGVVAYSPSLPNLDGQFLYGDYNLGQIWSVDSTGNVNTVIPSFPENIAAFGTDYTGEVLVVSYNIEYNPDEPSKIWKIVDNDVQSVTIPTLLSETNLFSDTATLTPAAGVIEYDVNVDGWFDGIVTRHFIALPDTDQIGFSATGDWNYPVGTALVKHMEVPLDNLGATKRFDTAILFKQSTGWIALNYQWNDDDTDATYITQSSQATYDMFVDGQLELRTLTHRDETKCSTCHTNGKPLSAHTRQLNKDFDYDGVVENQLDAWNSIHLFNVGLNTSSQYEAFGELGNNGLSATERSRAYLEVNCSHCHASASMDLRFDTPLAGMNVVNSDTGIGVHKITPFDPLTSGIYLRQSNDLGRMPNGTSHNNTEALQVLSEWITAANAQTIGTQITVDKTQVDINDTVTLNASEVYDNGFWIEGDDIAWTSSNSSVLDVGLQTAGELNLTPFGVGTTTITAMATGASPDSVNIVVVDASAIASVDIVPSNILVDSTYPAIAVAELGDGTTVNITNDADTTWSIVSGSAFASVSALGNITAIAPGDAVVQVDYLGHIAQSTITVGETGIWLRFNNPDNWPAVCIHIYNNTGLVLDTWPGFTLFEDNGWYEFFVRGDQLGTDGEINAIFNNCNNGIETAPLMDIDSNREYTGLNQNNWASWAGHDAVLEGTEHLIVALNATQTGDGTYPEGTIVTITADALSGQEFDYWSGDTAFIVDADVYNPVIDVVVPNHGLSLVPVYKVAEVDAQAVTDYANMCANCHGADGTNGIAPALNIANANTDSFEELVSKIQLDMPPSDPGICDQDCAEGIAAYILLELRGESLSCVAGPSTSPRLLRLLTRAEYVATLNDLVGVTPSSTAAIPSEAAVNGFANNSDNAEVTSSHYQAYLDIAGEVASQISEITNSSQIAAFGKRAFRRPLTSLEVSNYTSIYNTHGGDATEKAILSSPNFLYRVEAGDGSNGNYMLNDYEVATLMSYMFWGTMPDAALMTAADNGELSTTAGIKVQATRLANDVRARAMVGDFAAQWLQITDVEGVARNDAGFANVADDMLQETKDFFAHVIFDGDSTYQQLLTANFSIVSQDLADFYGYTRNADGTITYNQGKRAGILSHGSHLARNATFTEMHPVTRGLMVRESLLCQHLPQPEGIVVSFPPVDNSLTLRERFAVHTADPVCNECHQYIDGVGFGFSNFDKVGKWIDTENGIAIDSTGNMNDVEVLGEDIDNPYTTIPQLAQVIADSDSGKSCYVTAYYRYAHGYEEQDSDNCSLDTLAHEFQTGQISIFELMIELTQTNNFINRQ